MWEKYKLWVQARRNSGLTFSKPTLGSAQAPLYTKVMMEDIIKREFSVLSSSSCLLKATSPLDFEEANALQYCGGYLLQSLTKKVEKKSDYPLKESLLLCLHNLLEGMLAVTCAIFM